MDVEKRTTIVAGLNAEPMQEGLRQIATEAAKTAQSVNQSASSMGRTLLDAGRGFDALARKFVDGYADAQKFAQIIQTLQAAFRQGDSMGLYRTMLDNVERAYGTAGTAAKQFAETMGAVGTTAEQRARSLQQLIQVMQAVRRGQADMAAEIGRAPAQPAEYVPPQVSQQQRDMLRAYATGAVDMTGLATLGYDRALGGLGAAEARRGLLSQGLIAQTRAGGRFGPTQLVGGEAYQLAGVTPPPGTAGTQLFGEQFFRSFQDFLQREQQRTAAPSQYGVQPPSYVNRAQRQQELEQLFAPLVQQDVDQARKDAMSAYLAQARAQRIAPPSQFGVQPGLTAAETAQRQADLEHALGPLAIQQRQAELTRMGTEQFGPITLAQSQAANTRVGTQQFGPLSAAQLNDARAKYDIMFRVSKDYERSLAELDADLARGAISQRTYDTGLDDMNRRFAITSNAAHAHQQTLSSLTGTTGQQQFAMRQLGVQAIQTFQGFATGQPIMMTLIQQGHQVADVMLSAGVSFRSLATAVGNALTTFASFMLRNPLLLIAAGIAAIAAALALITYNAEQAAQRMSDLGNRLRATGGDAADRAARAADVEAVSRQVAATSPLSRAEAFTAGSTLVAAGFRGTRDEMAQLEVLANDLSKTIGSDLPTATKLLADGLDDAAGAAQRLHDQVGSKFPGLTQAAVDQLKLTQQAEGSAAAFQRLRQIIEGAAKGAGEETTKLTKAWHDFVEQLTRSDGVIGGLGTQLGNLLAHLLNLMTSILQVLEKIRQYTPNLPASIQQGRLVIGNTAAEGNNLVGLRPVGASSGFQTFGTPEESIAAGVRQLQINQDQHKIQTIADQVRRWAPPNENDTKKYMERVTQITGLDINAPFNTRDQEMVKKVISAIAQIETGRPIAEDIINKGVSMAFSGTPTTALGGVSQTDIDKANQASREALSVRIRENQAAQQEMQRNLDAALQRAQQAAATPGGEGAFKSASDEAVRFAEQLDKLKGAATDLITEQQKLARSATDATRPLQAEAGAARDLAQIEEQFREAARAANGGIIDQTALSEALAAKHKELATALNDTIRALDLETNMQNALTTATEQGGNLLQHSINFEKAMIDARKFAAAGTKEYAIVVTALTAAYDRNTEATKTNQAATDINKYQQENEQLQLQLKLIGATTAEVNRETAALQERQNLKLAPGDTPNAEQQRSIDAAKRTADLRTEVEKQKAAYQELENFGTSVFDTIGGAMEASFKKGADAAQVWKDALGNIMNEVIKEFTKVAIVNPLLNSLFGGSRPTLEDLGGALSKLGGGDKTGTGTGTDDVGSKVLKGLTGQGGLPIDPATNAMRVINVGLGGGTGGIPGIPGTGTGADGTGSGASGGNIADFMANLRAQDQGTDSSAKAGSSGGSASGSGSGGGGLLGTIFSKVGDLIKNFPGGLLNSVFGKGFYEGGGLFGSIFGSGSGGGGGPSIGASDVLGSSSADLSGGASTAGLYHFGGLVGFDAVPHRFMPPGLWDTAPHFQAGFANNEFAAVLHRSERVLTANQNDRLDNVLNRVASGDHGRGGPGGGGSSVVFNIQTPDADSFKASQSQINARAVAGLNRSQQRNRT